MLEQVKILTSRRAYEFGPNDLRLSSVSIQPVQLQIQQLLNFQSSAIGSPLPVFGEVQATYPPGIVFNIGAWVHQEEYIIPIRFLHFEPNRIVIDIAGPTEAIDGIADRLMHFLSSLKAGDGTPVIGEPVRVLDYSEITAQLPYPLDAIIPRPLRKLLSKTTGITDSEKSVTLIPSLVVQLSPTDEVVPAIPSANDPHAFTLALRSGTHPNEHILFSAAPIRSEAHLTYLDELVTSLKP
jgi:hypothetical protein